MRSTAAVGEGGREGYSLPSQTTISLVVDKINIISSDGKKRKKRWIFPSCEEVYLFHSGWQNGNGRARRLHREAEMDFSRRLTGHELFEREALPQERALNIFEETGFVSCLSTLPVNIAFQ